jgi:outer membrane scaffolding protein for murein synthesis (MipA/OmpV family)
MKRLFSAKSIAVAALALGAVGAASAAHARSDVFFSIGVPGAYVSNAPVYVQPEPVYVAPPVVQYEQPYYYNNYGNGVAYVYERDHHRYWRHNHRYGPYGDYDHDGVPNRFDRAPGNPYRH